MRKRKEKNHRFHCVHCLFKAKQQSKLELHVLHHEIHPAEYQCHLSSFSVNNRGSLALYLKLHYREMDENNLNNNMSDQLVINLLLYNKLYFGVYLFFSF